MMNEMSRYPLDENDLIDFLNEGPKVGEQIFREKFGYCPRGLLRILVGTILHKYKVGNLVAYQMINENFITENSEFVLFSVMLDV